MISHVQSSVSPLLLLFRLHAVWKCFSMDEGVWINCPLCFRVLVWEELCHLIRLFVARIQLNFMKAEQVRIATEITGFTVLFLFWNCAALQLKSTLYERFAHKTYFCTFFWIFHRHCDLKVRQSIITLMLQFKLVLVNLLLKNGVSVCHWLNKWSRSCWLR